MQRTVQYDPVMERELYNVILLSRELYNVTLLCKAV